MDSANPETTSQAVGMVLGTEDATPLQFWFAVDAGCKVQLDDIIMVEVRDPTFSGGSGLTTNFEATQDDAPSSDASDIVRFYGIVDEVRRRYEGVQFDGDTALVAQGLIPANIAYAAHVLVTRVEPEDFIPPGPGDTVYLARRHDLEKALYLDNMEAPLPAGVLRNGEVAYLNFDFINGTKGAHINISGISGIATKTSYALFLLYSIFNAHSKHDPRNKVLSAANSCKALVFNVKGEDLLFLDKANSRFEEQEGKWQRRRRAQQNRYSLCQLPVKPFDSVALHAPARQGKTLRPDSQSRENLDPYLWSLRDFAAERMLPFLLTERDAMTNLGFLVAHVEDKLAKLAEKQAGAHLFVESDGFRAADPESSDAPSARDAFGAVDFDSLASSGKERLETFDQLVEFLQYKLLEQGSSDDDARSGGDKAWTANQAKATREAFIRRLRGAAKYVRQLIRGDLDKEAMARGKLDILGSDKQVHVVDIHSLAPLAQMFVVGVLLKQIFSQREAGAGGQIFVVLDELNKYAPAEGDSPIKDVLLDIAERGRSMGVILIGAQQTASEVERRIVGNAAVRIVGRLDAAEAERSEYRFMPGSFRMRATILAPGTMIVHQPDVPSPMMLNFPFPAWATRKSESLQPGSNSDEDALEVLG